MDNDNAAITRHRHAAHWGPFSAVVDDGKIVGVEPFEHDPHPTPLIDAIPSAVHAPTRIQAPMVRSGWLEAGPGGRREARGHEPFVEVSWDEALDLVAGELRRVRDEHGNASIFGGSYGWASAGRFHHAKTQLKRFLNLLGGFTDQTGTYSNATGHVVVPHVVGSKTLARGPFTSWDSIAEHTDVFVAFGGIGIKNTQVEPGGMGEHSAHKWLLTLKDAKTEFVSVTPIAHDSADFLEAEWLPVRPGSDVALMLGLAYCWIEAKTYDAAFLDRYCVGFDQFRDYVTGVSDGVAKTPEWAAERCELSVETIRVLADRMAAGRTMINVSYSLQRAEHGEQAYWTGIALASMLGQIGLPGGGFGLGYGSMHGYGNPNIAFPRPTFSAGQNPAGSVIPVARIADLLLNPNGPYQFNGEDKSYPDTRLVYWCGGNPFHHHQDINRLVEAWSRPETIVVNEIWWTATARRADIVLPATTTLERNDIAASHRDRFILAMQKAVEPVGSARSDFAIFTGLAARLGFERDFTEDRDETTWLRHIYDVSRQQAAKVQVEMPDFDAFWEQGYFEIPEPDSAFILFESFRQSPDENPLGTPSGRIEIFSETVANFGYDDCPGHPAWLEPEEWLGGERAKRFPFHLISSQPPTRLHGQMDDASVSKGAKIKGREAITLNAADAAARGIRAGDVVRVFNDRGAVLAGAVLSERIRPGVVQLPTGAWYDPAEASMSAGSESVGPLDIHGNPNVLTPDRGTSRLAQGPTAHSALVNVERWDGPVPDITVHSPPTMTTR